MMNFPSLLFNSRWSWTYEEKLKSLKDFLHLSRNENYKVSMHDISYHFQGEIFYIRVILPFIGFPDDISESQDST